MFFRKKTDKELDEIKKQAGEEPTDMKSVMQSRNEDYNPAVWPRAGIKAQPVDDSDMHVFQSIQPFQPSSSLPQQKESIAPLFVKVERYSDLIASVQEMKSFVSGTKQLFSILNELESVRADTLKILKATVQRMEKSIIEIDSDLLRPRGFEFEVKQNENEVQHIESSLTDLQKQLMMLRRELQELK